MSVPESDLKKLRIAVESLPSGSAVFVDHFAMRRMYNDLRDTDWARGKRMFQTYKWDEDGAIAMFINGETFPYLAPYYKVPFSKRRSA